MNSGYELPDSINHMVDFVSSFNLVKNGMVIKLYFTTHIVLLTSTPLFISYFCSLLSPPCTKVSRVTDVVPKQRHAPARDYQQKRYTSNAPQIMSQNTFSGGYFLNGVLIPCIDGSDPDISGLTSHLTCQYE
jgi:hypothetical protein